MNDATTPQRRVRRVLLAGVITSGVVALFRGPEIAETIQYLTTVELRGPFPYIQESGGLT